MVVATKKHLSPLRYPGGKAKLTPIIEQFIALNCNTQPRYVEPFAGGAGVALSLLVNGMASEIVLNDADFAVYCFWSIVFTQTDRFLSDIEKIDISVKEWLNQQEILKNQAHKDLYHIGFAFFYINRTSRSGLVTGSGPIGGYNQAGKWKIDARFNRKELSERISLISKYKERVTLRNLDAYVLLSEFMDSLTESFFYIDPPYYEQGPSLYLNYYDQSDHMKLAKYLLASNSHPWVATYDKHPYIRDLYTQAVVKEYQLEYSLHTRRKASELFIIPKHVDYPDIFFR